MYISGRQKRKIEIHIGPEGSQMPTGPLQDTPSSSFADAQSGSTSNETLRGKAAIVTGSSRGIGRSIALRLARDGAKLLLVARTRTALETVAAEITATGGLVTVLAADLRDPEIPAAVVEAAIGTYGAIDILVNNAGATRRGDFLELTDADWVDGFALKFFGAVRLVRGAWPHLQRSRGSILNIVGIGGRTPGAEFTIGGSVNGACLSFTKALADVGIRDGVQVNAINPGWVRTDRLRTLLKTSAEQLGGDMEAAVKKVVQQSNIVRLGEPEDVANLAAFVLSPEGRLLQGSLIDLDGGQTKTL
jgi:NAD(P)-dependent dehydrogenase (short-subunit alcohol dehydrogenase family)